MRRVNNLTDEIKKVKEFADLIVGTPQSKVFKTSWDKERKAIISHVLREVYDMPSTKIAKHVYSSPESVNYYLRSFGVPDYLGLWFKAYKVNGWIPVGIEKYA